MFSMFSRDLSERLNGIRYVRHVGGIRLPQHTLLSAAHRAMRMRLTADNQHRQGWCCPSAKISAGQSLGNLSEVFGSGNGCSG
jgi:hypothetical protein